MNGFKEDQDRDNFVQGPHISVSYSTKGAAETGCDGPCTTSPYRSACLSS